MGRISKQSKDIQDKINRLELHSGIDTVQIKSKTRILDFTADEYPGIHTSYKVKAENGFGYYIFNPNTARESYIEDFKEYDQTITDMLNGFPIENPEKYRIDYRLDSFKSDYDDLLKLNTLLLLLISQGEGADNNYISQDPMMLHNLTVRIQKSREFIAENYNKEYQTERFNKLNDVDGNVKNRLELRTLRVGAGEPIERTEWEKWCNIIDRAVTAHNLKALTDFLNIEIALRYAGGEIEITAGKTRYIPAWKEREGKGFSSNVFFHDYRHNIFTREQFIKLHNILDFPNADVRVRDYLRRHPYDIQLFTLDDLLIYTEKLKQAGRGFFDR